MNRLANKTFAILGLGLFGSALARTLATEGCDVIAIDKMMEHVEEVMDVVGQPIQGDFTKLDHLKEAGVGNCDVAIIATSNRLEDAILAILNLQKLKVPHIIVKTKNKTYREVLIKLGADEVILPETEMGVRMARELANPTFEELISLNEDYNIGIINVKKEWDGKTLKELNMREEYGVNIIAIKPKEELESDNTISIDPDYILHEEDQLIGIAPDEGIPEIFE